MSVADGVVVYAPARTPNTEIALFVLSKREWLAKSLDRVNDYREKTKRPVFMDRTEVLYRGVRHQLRFDTGSPASVHNSEGCITVTVPAKDTPEAYYELLWKTLVNWMLQDAMKTLSELLKRRATEMGVGWRMASIKSMKSRWGSCSRNGNMSLHWALIMAPPEVADYVVVHELAHRTHMNHSEAFWKHVERFQPEYVIHRKWLKLNGWELIL